MKISSIYGSYSEGYLRGDALTFAEGVIKKGGRVSCQGPEQPGSEMVTLLYQPPGCKGLSVWGKTTLYNEP